MLKQIDRGEFHEPILVHEVLECFELTSAHLNNQVQNGHTQKRKFIDATVGTAGHTVEIVKAGGEVLGIDADCEILKIAEKRLREACPTTFSLHERGSYKLVCANFKEIDKIAQDNGFDKVSGILFDLGVSNLHLSSASRGFSFQSPNAQLDMRLNPEVQAISGADLLNGLREDQLKVLFGKTLNFVDARKIVEAIVCWRKKKKIETVGDFIEICKVVRGKPGLHPATVQFLALRIAVNSELENLSEVLPKAFSLLTIGGKMLVITFHSLEDTIVKGFFRKKMDEGVGEVEKKPLVPTLAEVARNPKARSAKLRVMTRRV